ncbi:MAG: MFS transporter [Synechococcales cyanobacterium]
MLKALNLAQRRDLRRLFAAGLLFWMSLSAFLPTLPRYVQDLGGSPQIIGLTMTSFAVGLLLSRPAVDALGNRHGYRAVLWVGMGSLVVAPLGYWLFPSVAVVVVMRGIQGISIAAFATAYMALVADWAPPHQRGELIGTMSLINPIGMSIGPVFGEALRVHGGYGSLFAITAGLALGGMLVIADIRQAGSYPQGSPVMQGSLGRVWRQERIAIPSLVMLLAGLAFGTLSTFVAVFIPTTGTDLNPGWFYGTAALASFGMRWKAGAASDRSGRGIWISFCLLCMAMSLVVLSLAHQPWHFLLAGWMEGLGFGLLIPMFSAWISDRSQPGERARLLNLCTGGFDGGIALAGPLAGSLVVGLGYRPTFAVAAGMALLSWILFATRGNYTLSQSWQFALGNGLDQFAEPVTESRLGVPVHALDPARGEFGDEPY